MSEFSWVLEGNEHLSRCQCNRYDRYLPHQEMSIGFLDRSDYDGAGKPEFDQPWKGIQLQLKSTRIAEPSIQESDHASA